MDFKRYFGKIKNKNEKPKQKSETIDETEDNIIDSLENLSNKDRLGFNYTENKKIIFKFY